MVHSSGRDTLPNQTDQPEQRSGLARWLYRLIAFASALFILTIFVTIAVTLSDPTVPANREMSDWLDRYAAPLLIAEVIAVGVLVLSAFVVDRRESWKRYHREYAEWEQRMQQLTGKNGTNPQSDPRPKPSTSSGDAE
jgi:hypothetical protein